MKEHRLEKLGEMVARMRSFLEKDLERTVRLDVRGRTGLSYFTG